MSTPELDVPAMVALLNQCADLWEDRAARSDGYGFKPDGVVQRKRAGEVRALAARLPEMVADAKRLDWMESQTWITLSKTDESDNNGVGATDAAVALQSDHPDGKDFPSQLGATFRKVLDAAMQEDRRADR